MPPHKPNAEILSIPDIQRSRFQTSSYQYNNKQGKTPHKQLAEAEPQQNNLLWFFLPPSLIASTLII